MRTNACQPISQQIPPTASTSARLVVNVLRLIFGSSVFLKNRGCHTIE